MKRKEAALLQMAEAGIRAVRQETDSLCWFFNFAPGYHKAIRLFGKRLPTSNGYRANAARTHAVLFKFLRKQETAPAGIVWMDFAGTDRSHGYATRGKELVRRLIEGNFASPASFSPEIGD